MTLERGKSLVNLKRETSWNESPVKSMSADVIEERPVDSEIYT